MENKSKMIGVENQRASGRESEKVPQKVTHTRFGYRLFYMFVFYKLCYIGLVNKYRHGSKTRYKGDILTFDSRERNRKKIFNKANNKKTRQEK
jgi:hypothetical protein